MESNTAMEQKGRMVAGCGFGALVGLLIGLSLSDVVSTFLTAIMAIAAVILGTAPLPKNDKFRIDHAQLSCFAIACVVALLCGVYGRSNGLLGQSVDRQLEHVKKWTNSGVPIEYAVAIVTGVHLGVERKSSADPQRRATIAALSAGLSTDTCGRLDPQNVKGIENRLRTLDSNNLSNIANKIRRAADGSDRDAMYEMYWRFECS